MNDRLMIGTAQFGQKYGIASGYNQVSEEEVPKILEFAGESGIKWIDTAGSYGCAENVLGRIQNISEFNIVTKVFLNKGKESPKRVLEYIEKSLFLLNIKKLYGVLIHDPNDLIQEDRRHEIFGNMETAKSLGYVNKIGVSVSFPEQAAEIITKHPIDIIQIPCNILDQRFVNSGVMKDLADRNVEIHARSIFLQGLLLMDIENLDPFFDGIKSNLVRLRDFAARHNKSMIEVAIDYIKSLKSVSKIVVGIDNEKQLRQIVSDWKRDAIECNFDEFCIDDERFIIPSNWGNKKL